MTAPAAVTHPCAVEALTLSPLVAGHNDLAWEARDSSAYSVEGIDGSLAVLRGLARLDVRYLTLTHNDNTPWADAEMNLIGTLVDISHVAATTMPDALDASAAPVIFGHSSCRAVTDHPRNVPDDVLGRLPANCGVIMITYVPHFVNQTCADWSFGDRTTPAPPSTVDDVVAHVEHPRDVAGIEHIGLGSDYDGVAVFPTGMGDVTGHAVLLDRLAERGWSATDLARLMGDNILRVLDATETR